MDIGLSASSAWPSNSAASRSNSSATVSSASRNRTSLPVAAISRNSKALSRNSCPLRIAMHSTMPCDRPLSNRKSCRRINRTFTSSLPQHLHPRRRPVSNPWDCRPSRANPWPDADVRTQDAPAAPCSALSSPCSARGCPRLCGVSGRARRSCPQRWCKSLRLHYALWRFGQGRQSAMAGRLTAASSLNVAMVSRVM
jgi:hypothetical protein